MSMREIRKTFNFKTLYHYAMPQLRNFYFHHVDVFCDNYCANN